MTTKQLLGLWLITAVVVSPYYFAVVWTLGEWFRPTVAYGLLLAAAYLSSFVTNQLRKHYENH